MCILHQAISRRRKRKGGRKEKKKEKTIHQTEMRTNMHRTLHRTSAKISATISLDSYYREWKSAAGQTPGLTEALKVKLLLNWLKPHPHTLLLQRPLPLPPAPSLPASLCDRHTPHCATPRAREIHLRSDVGSDVLPAVSVPHLIYPSIRVR